MESDPPPSRTVPAVVACSRDPRAALPPAFGRGRSARRAAEIRSAARSCATCSSSEFQGTGLSGQSASLVRAVGPALSDRGGDSRRGRPGRHRGARGRMSLEVVEACGRKGVRALVVISAGFKEVGPRVARVKRPPRACGAPRHAPRRSELPRHPEYRPGVVLNATFAPVQPLRGACAVLVPERRLWDSRSWTTRGS
jgi:hypothetical protein